MDFQSTNIWCWSIPALVGVICGILGYLMGKGSNHVVDDTANLKLLKDRNAKLESDLADRDKKLSVKAPPVKPVNPFDRFAAKEAFGKAVKQDDLKIIEGIGPKIEKLFHNFDIKTWKALSKASVASCQKILDSGGERYKIHDPASWPMQARMCDENKWADLRKWQDEHKSGKF
ncbi:hypothetical protein K8352_01410 [Flavobacteriaceae bacterium F89]|uniref:LSU ribosomal protein L21p n=1 Tax=Cerina litoralis TaxID=2874477 RepID=A0AAE3ES77_9FLAO|nr:hypothetical protein [Cerina litoralis]MCG2459400.1 hypothetical protein [Cerina litoralis]